MRRSFRLVAGHPLAEKGLFCDYIPALVNPNVSRVVVEIMRPHLECAVGKLHQGRQLQKRMGSKEVGYFEALPIKFVPGLLAVSYDPAV